MEQKPIEPLPHSEVIDEAVKPTCEAEGWTEGIHCSECGTILVEQKPIPAMSHEFGDDGVCINCGQPPS